MNAFILTQMPGSQRSRPFKRAFKDPLTNGTRSGPPTTKPVLFLRGTSYDRTTNGTKYRHPRHLNPPPVLATRPEDQPGRMVYTTATVLLPVLIRQAQSAGTRNSGIAVRLTNLSLRPCWRLKGVELPRPDASSPHADHTTLLYHSLPTHRGSVP